MGTYYKGNGILDDKILERYIDGEWLREDGQVEKLNAPINKYNKLFIQELNSINREFYTIVRANDIAIELIKKYHAKSGEIRNLMHITSAQSATIRYNRTLKKALSKYGIKQHKIYNSIQKDITSQKSRLVRNKQLIDLLFEEFGISKISEKIKEETSMDFVSYIQYLEDNSGIEKPLLLGASEDNKIKEDSYYKQLTQYELSKIEEFIKKYSINISASISKSLQTHRDNLEKQREQRKEERAQGKEDNKYNKAIMKLHENNSYVQQDIMANWDDKLRRLGRGSASDIFRTVSRLGVAYYVAVVELRPAKIMTSVKYCSLCDEDSIELDDKPDQMLLFETLDEAQNARTRLLKEYDFGENTPVAKVHRLTGIRAKESIYSDKNIAKYREKYIKEQKEEEEARLQEFERLQEEIRKRAEEAERIKLEKELKIEEDIEAYKLRKAGASAEEIEAFRNKFRKDKEDAAASIKHKLEEADREERERRQREQKDKENRIKELKEKLVNSSNESIVTQINNECDIYKLDTICDKYIHDYPRIFKVICIKRLEVADWKEFIGLEQFGVRADKKYFEEGEIYYFTNNMIKIYALKKEDYRIIQSKEDIANIRKIINMYGSFKYDIAESFKIQVVKLDTISNEKLFNLRQRVIDAHRQFIEKIAELEITNNVLYNSFNMCRGNGKTKLYAILFIGDESVKYYSIREDKFEDRITNDIYKTTFFENESAALSARRYILDNSKNYNKEVLVKIVSIDIGED